MSIIESSLDVVPRSDRERRYFTLAQANRSLILLKRIVAEVVREYGVLMDLEEMIESLEQDNSRHQLELARQNLVTTVDNLQSCLEELDQVGVELRDFSRGIVDFPACHRNRDISFCWMLGEKTISHWHEQGKGFASRQPVELLSEENTFATSLI